MQLCTYQHKLSYEHKYDKVYWCNKRADAAVDFAFSVMVAALPQRVLQCALNIFIYLYIYVVLLQTYYVMIARYLYKK